MVNRGKGWKESPDGSGKAPRHRAVAIKTSIEETLKVPMQLAIPTSKEFMEKEVNAEIQKLMDKKQKLETELVSIKKRISDIETKLDEATAHISTKDTLPSLSTLVEMGKNLLDPEKIGFYQIDFMEERKDELETKRDKILEQIDNIREEINDLLKYRDAKVH